MKKELKLIILILFIFLIIILFGVSIFYKYCETENYYSNNSNTKTNIYENLEEQNNYEEYKKEANEIDKQIEQEFDKINKKSEN